MSPPRLYSPVPLQPEKRYTLDSDQSRYLTRALRLRVGDKVVVFDGSGGEYVATILGGDKSAVDIVTGGFQDRCLESPLRIQLLQGISKGDRMDTVVQKATELGVHTISPVVTEHSVVKLSGERAVRRCRHWQKISQSACEQCGRNIVPGIDAISHLAAWHDNNKHRGFTRLILTPAAATPIPRVENRTVTITLLIGPEGGFSNLEYQRAGENGFTPISLGPRVLRTETAAIAAISAFQTLWGDFRT